MRSTRNSSTSYGPTSRHSKHETRLHLLLHHSTATATPTVTTEVLRPPKSPSPYRGLAVEGEGTLGRRTRRSTHRSPTRR
jgi:hypothetical protein